MKVEIDQFRQRVQALFFGENMLTQIARDTRDAVHAWYAKLPEDWFDNPKPFPDGTPRHEGVRTFMAPLRSAWEWAVADNGFEITFAETRKVPGKSSTAWGLRLQQYGQVIKPVEKKALTIPVTAEARGRTAKMFEQATGHKLFVVKKREAKDPNHIGSLVWEDPGGELHAAFVLRKSADVKPLRDRRGHDAIPSQEQLGKWAADSYLKYLKYSFLYG